MSFKERLASRYDGQIDAAYSVRPPGTSLTVGVCAGVCAGVGAALGGPLVAGIGGGLGAILGYAIVALRARGSGLAPVMALVLEPERLVVVRLRTVGSRPAGALRSVPYSELQGVEAEENLLVVKLRLRSSSGELALEGGRYGIGPATAAGDELRRRAAAT